MKEERKEGYLPWEGVGRREGDVTGVLEREEEAETEDEVMRLG